MFAAVRGFATIATMSETTAYHEAGHAFVAWQLGARVLALSIDPDWDDGPRRFGDAQIAWDRDEFDEAEIQQRSLIVALAGPDAEMIHTGDRFHPALVTEWRQDWKVAWNLAAQVFPDQRKRMVFLEQTAMLIHERLSNDDQWAALANLVDHLLAHETLEEDQIEEVLDEWRNAWPV